jgi:NADH:ubiquinone oxidoreductase subunit 4 (subunit M)
MQTDLKAIIAYSRVVHINIIIRIFITSINKNKIVMVITIIAHALISGLIFYKSGIIFYLNKTRIIKIIGNYSIQNLFFTIILLRAFILNFSPPPSFGFLGEILTFFFIYKKYKIIFLFIFFLGILSAYFCVLNLSNILKNKKKKNIIISFSNYYTTLIIILY